MATKKNGGRRAAKEGTIRKRADGRWEGRYSIGRHPGTGKQIQKSFYAKTQAEVRMKLQQMAVDIENGTYIEPSKMTIEEWFNIWVRDFNVSTKPRTRALYIGQINYRIIPGIGAVKLSELKPHEVQTFLNQQTKAQGDKKALSAKSLKNLHGILHKALEQAVSCGYLKENPSSASKLKLPKWNKPDIKPLDNKQITDFLRNINGHPLAIFFMVDLFTGLRQAEIIGLTWDCIRGDTLHIYRQLQLMKGEYVFGSLKNNKTRTITPASAVMQLLQEQRKKQEEMKAQAGSAWNNPENFVFTNELGRHLAQHTVYKGFKRIAKNMGIPSSRFHDLRHSYAVAALQAGVNIKKLQEDMGHHSAAFTLDVYGHVTEQMRQESAARMDNFIQSVTIATNVEQCKSIM
jgi:integrase